MVKRRPVGAGEAGRPCSGGSAPRSVAPEPGPPPGAAVPPVPGSCTAGTCRCGRSRSCAQSSRWPPPRRPELSLPPRSSALPGPELPSRRSSSPRFGPRRRAVVVAPSTGNTGAARIVGVLGFVARPADVLAGGRAHRGRRVGAGRSRDGATGRAVGDRDGRGIARRKASCDRARRCNACKQENRGDDHCCLRHASHSFRVGELGLLRQGGGRPAKRGLRSGKALANGASATLLDRSYGSPKATSNEYQARQATRAAQAAGTACQRVPGLPSAEAAASGLPDVQDLPGARSRAARHPRSVA